MQWHRGPYTIDTDRDRLDMPTIITWLQGTYWAAGRSAELIRQSWAASAVVAGVYAGADLVGWARVVTDGVVVAYLADVFIVPQHRRQGIGRWLVATLLAHPELGTVRWLLHTRDAQAFYQGLGFVAVGPRIMERARIAMRQATDVDPASGG